MGLHVNDNGLDFSVSVQDGESDSYHVWERSITRKVNCGKHHGTHVCINWLKNVNVWSSSAMRLLIRVDGMRKKVFSLARLIGIEGS